MKITAVLGWVTPGFDDSSATARPAVHELLADRLRNGRPRLLDSVVQVVQCGRLVFLDVPFHPVPQILDRIEVGRLCWSLQCRNVVGIEP